MIFTYQCNPSSILLGGGGDGRNGWKYAFARGARGEGNTRKDEESRNGNGEKGEWRDRDGYREREGGSERGRFYSTRGINTW